MKRIGIAVACLCILWIAANLGMEHYRAKQQYVQRVANIDHIMTHSLRDPKIAFECGMVYKDGTEWRARGGGTMFFRTEAEAVAWVERQWC